MLEIKNVYKTFNPGTVNQKVALNDLNLTLEDGDFVTVIGGNGAGKSTMLNAVAGVWPVDMGKIIIDGKDITRLPEHKRARKIGILFQDPMKGTAPNMTLAENLVMAYTHGHRFPLAPALRRRNRQAGFERVRRHQHLQCGVDTVGDLQIAHGLAGVVMRQQAPDAVGTHLHLRKAGVGETVAHPEGVDARHLCIGHEARTQRTGRVVERELKFRSCRLVVVHAGVAPSGAAVWSVCSIGGGIAGVSRALPAAVLGR